MAVGPMAGPALDAAGLLEAQGIGVTVVDPRWVKPVSPDLVDLVRGHRLVATVEDNGRVGGCGAALHLALSDAGIDVPLVVFGLPQQFLAQAKRAAVLAKAGLTGPSIATDLAAALSALTPPGSTADEAATDLR